jgi:hypothetical protein
VVSAVDFTCFASDNSGTVTSRICEQTECNENQGLVTEFDSAVVPEPAHLGFVLFGLLILVGIHKHVLPIWYASNRNKSDELIVEISDVQHQ